MRHMATVEEAEGKESRVGGKAFLPLPENFFRVSGVKEGKMSHIVPGAEKLLTLFLMKPDQGNESSVSTKDSAVEHRLKITHHFTLQMLQQ